MARTLLPPNASLLERTVDATLPTGWAAMAGQVEPQANPPALLPWVAQQWQISQFESYFPTTQALLNAGLPWLRERGSAAAVKRALGWLGYTGAKLEEDGARLHINPGREVTNADIRAMAHVVRASIPLHVKFYRIYYRFDMRLLRWDNRPGWDAALWDNYSGTPVDMGDGTEVIGSQGSTKSTLVPIANLAPILGAGQHYRAGMVRRADTMRWDVWRWDAAVQAIPGVGGAHGAAMWVPLYQRLPAFSGRADAMGALVLAPRGQALGGTTTANSTAVPNRFNDSRAWVGGWDAATWQQITVQSNHTEQE